MESNNESPKLDLFLKSNILVPKTSPTFYHKLQFWKAIKYKSIDSKADVLNQYLWYNDKIQINQAPIYSRHFDDRGIKKIGHITNDDGSDVSYRTWIDDWLVHHVMTGELEQFQQTGREVCTLHNNCYVNVNGNKVELQKIVHKEIYKALVTKTDR